MPDPVLIQPVESPVICKPYYEPTQYWEYDRNTGRAQKMEGRRAASYWYKDPSADNRAEYYARHHVQEIEFEIARQIVAALVGEGTQAPVRGSARTRGLARHELFPQVLRIVRRYVADKVDFRDANPCELGLEKYVRRIKERLLDAIVPDEQEGEMPILPILIPYEYEGVQHHYEPDYLIRMKNGKTTILETKGEEDDQDRAKHQAARRWVTAVNNWGRLGVWTFIVCRDPQLLPRQLAADPAASAAAPLRG